MLNEWEPPLLSLPWLLNHIELLLADPLEERFPGWAVEGALVLTSCLSLSQARVSSLFTGELPGRVVGEGVHQARGQNSSWGEYGR